MSQHQAVRHKTKNYPQQLPTPDPGTLQLNFARDVSTRRPSLPRTLSKRHASFNSPREVPLPSPSMISNSSQFSYFSDIGTVDSGFLSKSRPTTPLDTSFSAVFDEQADEAGWTDEATPKRHQQYPSSSKLTTAKLSPSNILPFPRPYSVPHHYSSAPAPAASHVPASEKTNVDRSTSSVSLPIPTHIPFHALPKVGSRNRDAGSREELDNDHHETKSSGPIDSNSTELLSDDYTANNSSAPSLTYRRSNPGPVNRDTSYPHLRDPPHTNYYPLASNPSDTSSLEAATAMHSPVVVSHSPEPPTILPIPPLPASPTPPISLPSDPQGSSPLATPASPTRLTTSQPPYTAFLSHAPPPPDSGIHVETTPSEYRLNVRLPGFQRDGITLASKKRRILHIVADSWGSGGGHFERRIALGYDADFGRIHADFDGEMLKIVVSRSQYMGYAV